MPSDNNDPLSPDVALVLRLMQEDAMTDIDSPNRISTRRKIIGEAIEAAYRLGLKHGHGELAGKHAEWCSRVCPCEAAIREAKGVGRG